MIVAFIVVLVVALVLFGAVVLLSHGITVDRSSASWSYTTRRDGARGYTEHTFDADSAEMTCGPWYCQIVVGRWRA